jgi:aspartate kinase
MTSSDPSVPPRADIAFDTVVMKFGGSSVADADKVRGVAERLVQAKRSGLRVVGTVSAMGKTTDSLIALAHEVSPQPDGREMDMLLSTGERISCALVAMAIHDLGFEAVSFTGSQAGIVTDDAHGRAKIREIRAQRVLHALDEGKIVLVAGFQGVSSSNDVTTLGRGGTDATAVALAAALGAACEIYSDVAGVYTSDPRIVPGARKLPRISYEEMLEMSASGAKVLMLRSVELARNHNVRVHSRSTFSQEEGTWIVPAEEVMEHPIISGVTHSQSEVIFTLTGLPDRPGAAATVFDSVAAENVNVDTIIQNVVHGVAELSFSVPHEDVPGTRRAIAFAEQSLGVLQVEEDDEMGKVSLIGAGMRSHPGVAARMFRTLADLDINLRMISTSPIKISCMIARDEVPTAVRALHDAFELENAPTVEA